VLGGALITLSSSCYPSVVPFSIFYFVVVVITVILLVSRLSSSVLLLLLLLLLVISCSTSRGSSQPGGKTPRARHEKLTWRKVDAAPRRRRLPRGGVHVA